MYFENFKKYCSKSNLSNYVFIEPSIPEWIIYINQCEEYKNYNKSSIIDADNLTYLNLKEFIEDYKGKEGIICFSNNKVLKFNIIFDDTKFKNMKDSFEKRLNDIKNSKN